MADVLVDGSSVGAVTTHTFFDITANHTIEASFQVASTYTVDVTAGSNGSVSPGDTTLNCGAAQPFTVTADSGYKIHDVLVDGVSVVDPATVGSSYTHTFSDIAANHTLAATFTGENDCIVTTVAGANGSISPAGPVGVAPGATRTFYMNPDAGYDVTEVRVDGSSVGLVGAVDVTCAGSDIEIEASFDFGAPAPALATCVDISQTPLNTKAQPAAPLIMFVLDNSSSMFFEMMTDDSSFEFGGNSYRRLWDLDGVGETVLPDNHRGRWLSQFSPYNKVFYNPQMTYEPWVKYSDADTATPRTHPILYSGRNDPDGIAGGRIDLRHEFTKLGNRTTVIVDNADDGFSVTAGTFNNAYHDDAFAGIYKVSETTTDVKSVRWTPGLEPARYDVYVRWAADDDPNNVPQNDYYVVPDGATTYGPYRKNHREGGGSWVRLGGFNFTAAGYVGLQNDDGNLGFMTADAVKFVPQQNITSISVKNAHYYTWHDADNDEALDNGETVYLVNFVNGTRHWYIYDDDGDDVVENTELTRVSENSVPAGVRPNDAADDLQNFANWFKYHRRRSIAAQAAMAEVINDAEGVQIGIVTITRNMTVPVKKIGVDGVDARDSLLDDLYAIEFHNGTPLREGLEVAGQYFHANDGINPAGLGASPFASKADGGECQQCFAILIGDGSWKDKGHNRFPYTDVSVGNADGDNNSPWDGGVYGDNYARTLADVAMYYYENDLVDDATLADHVPTNARDSATHQHMVTYTISFGRTPNIVLDPDYLETGNYPTWTNPWSNQDNVKIDDIIHAAINGRGRYFEAQNPEELTNDLLTILKEVKQFAASSASVAVNGDELYTRINDSVVLHQSKYYSGFWHGDVLAYSLDFTTGQLVQPALWSAAQAMSLQSDDDRILATFDGTSAGIPFRFDSLETHHKDLLDASWQTDDGNARDIVDYVRGDAGNEIDNGGTFRNRTWAVRDDLHPYNGSVITSSALGTIVHSSPVHHEGVLYVGANDGMLHALDAGTGRELFGYVPFQVFGNLKGLPETPFTHKYFVDLTPTVAEVELSGTDATLLVGGLGGGGRGYFALNVTDVESSGTVFPASESDLADMVMWEYPDMATENAEYADLGYSYSQPAVVATYDPSHPYVVIFGNGYNSPNKQAVLFILDPETGDLLKRIPTVSVADCNGLSTPLVVDVNADKKADYVYAGDLLGNMWKFDLTADSIANWDVAFSASGTNKPLFTTDSQPITTRPDVRFHCDKDGYLVMFGTGKYLEDSDAGDTSPQAIYGIWDYGDDEDDGEYVGVLSSGTFAPAAQLPGGSQSLLQQGVDELQTANNVNYRVLTAGVPDWTTTRVNPDTGDCGDFSGVGEDCDPNPPGTRPDPIRDIGWYIDLPEPGERVVSNVIAREENLIVVTHTPSDDNCNPGGSSWVMVLDACTGGRLGEANFDVNGDEEIDDQDKLLIKANTADEIEASPTGVQFGGQLQSPSIIIQPGGKENLYLSSSEGDVKLLLEKAPRLGMYFWNLYRP